MPTPNSVAQTILAAQEAQPLGRPGIVSKPSEAVGSPLARWAQMAAGTIRQIGQVTADSLSPANIFVPGGSQGIKTAVEVAKNGGEAAKNVGEGVKEAAAAAGEGIKTGFGIATFLIIGLVGLYLFAMFKPRS